MKLLLLTALFLTEALSLPASLSFAATTSALFSAIHTSAVPTTSSSALFSAIPTSVVPATTSSSIVPITAVPTTVFADIAKALTGGDDDEDVDVGVHTDDTGDRPHPTMDAEPANNNMSTPHNISNPYSQTGSGSTPYRHPYQPHHNMNHTAPYLNLTLTSTSNKHDSNDNDDDMPLTMNIQIDENTEDDDDDDDDEVVLPIGLAPVNVSLSSSNGTSTADLIPDSRIEA